MKGNFLIAGNYTNTSEMPPSKSRGCEVLMWGRVITQSYSFGGGEEKKKFLTYACTHQTNYHLTWRNLGAAAAEAAAGTGKKNEKCMDVDERMWKRSGVCSAARGGPKLIIKAFNWRFATHLCFPMQMLNLQKPA